MKRIRFRDEEPSTGGVIAGVALGALAGLVVGIVVAQRAGGLSGLTKKIRDQYDALSKRHKHDDALDSGNDHDGYDDSDEELDDDNLDADSELEEGVLKAFRRDAVLSERAIDIGAIGEGIIELSGWVETHDEAEHAVAVTRTVDGIVTVVNRLFVGADEPNVSASDLDEDELDGETNKPIPGGVWEGQRVGTGRRRQGNSSEVDRHVNPKPVLEEHWLDEQHALDEAAGPIDGIAERRRGKKAKSDKSANGDGGPQGNSPI